MIALEQDDREGYDDAQATLALLPGDAGELTGLEAIYRATRAAYAGDLPEAQAIVDHTLAETASRFVTPVWRDRLVAVRALIRSALGGPVTSPTIEGPRGDDEDDFARLMRAAALVATGHLRQAAAHMHDVRRPEPTEVALRILAALLDGALAVRGGGAELARRHIARAGELGRRSDSRRMWLCLTKADGALLEALLPGAAPANLDTPFPGLLESGVSESIGLTARELAVLRELARGSSTRGTADELGVSINTVKTQLRSLYRKLGVTTREEALGRAREAELL